MTPERWARIEELFHRAAETAPPSRAALLDEACGNDLELRQQVEALLAADQSARSRMRSVVRSELEAAAFSLIGTTVSHYRILGALGGGGMGLVYRAEDVKLGRRVAIKFLPEDSAKDPDALRRFEREARSASALESPNICPVYEFGEHEGQPFLAMQLLDGQTLRELIASGPPGKLQLTGTKLLDISIQIAYGLSAAHKQGILHRDIKPANIFVTTQGEVKILDFGLAKLLLADTEATDTPRTNIPAASLFLTRTGIRAGTAAYMSPEQIRGEKLDARTDLFSFGLVLYEIATGQRAIKGESGPELHQAILTQTPTPPRRLNPAIPPKLQKIIEKCIEKDRQARYQSASEIRHDLQQLKGSMELRLRWLAAGALVGLLAISIFMLIHRRQPVQPSVQLNGRQLTANSIENGVSGGMISPNGKYLAFSDRKGLHLQTIETGETSEIPLPRKIADRDFDWKCATWAPDSSRFLANFMPLVYDPGQITDDDVSIWEIPLVSRLPAKLRTRAVAWSFSPDGSLIAFGTNRGPHGPREIWLMDANGGNARKLFESGNDDSIYRASWSADGRRLVYARGREPGTLKRDELFSHDLQAGPPVVLEKPAEFRKGDPRFIASIITLPDGRSVFSATEEQTAGRPVCNFWVAKNDLLTGKLLDGPRQLTNWGGSCMEPTSITSDLKTLAFLNFSTHRTVYVADLQAGGTRTANERHLTLTETMDIAWGWTSDSQSVLIGSRRNGRYGFYKQTLDGAASKLIFARKDFAWFYGLTPDEQWFLYSEPGPNTDLMRIPVGGGEPKKMFFVKNLEGATCLPSPSKLCVVLQRSDDRKEAIITSFHPEKGLGAELTRFAVDPNVDWPAALSPDLSRIALIRRTGAPLEILSVKGAKLQEIKIPAWTEPGEMHWASDGKALYVPVRALEGTSVLRVDLEGRIHVVRVNRGGIESDGIPSPDGRHLAITDDVENNNIWIVELPGS